MSDWYAFSTIQEAIDDTKEILLPFNWRTWARLMLIVTFVGGGSGLPIGGFPGGENTGQYPGSSTEPTTYNIFADLPEMNSMTGLSTAGTPGSTSLGLLGVFVIGLIAAVFYLNSVFSFILYQSLLDREVRVRRNFRKHAYNGFRYFLFQMGVIAVIALLLLVALIPIGVDPLISIPLLLLWILLLIPVAIFLGLTQNFILIRVIETDTGFIEAWKSFYSEIEGELDEIAVYILVRFVLKTLIAVMGAMWLIISLLLVGIPFGVIGLALFAVAKWLIAIPIILGLITWAILIIAFRVPVQTFLTHYAILVYRELIE